MQSGRPACRHYFTPHHPLSISIPSMAPFRIQILSDLHLEMISSAYEMYDFAATAPNLALLGDIGLASQSAGLLAFLTRQLRRYERVFYVLGNHEPYHSSWALAKSTLLNFEAQLHHRKNPSDAGEPGGGGQLGEFVFLDQRRYDVPGEDQVTVLGCTLFSRIDPDQRKSVAMTLNDFYHIEAWTPEAHDAAHRAHLAWLNQQVGALERAGRRALVFTHHSPTVSEKANDPVHRESPIKSAFVTDLSRERCWNSPAVKLWAFGHTHYNIENFEVDRTGGGGAVVTNQRGYYFKLSPAFDEARVFEV